MRFEVVEAKVWHCGAIVRRLRHEHASAMVMLGLSSHHNIRAVFDDSSFRRAWLVDGKLAGLGGVTGPMIATDGLIWLALTEDAARYRVAAAREATRQLAQIMTTKHRLHTTLIPEDRTALRFATRLGFEVDHFNPIPAGNGRVLSVSITRRALQAA